MGKEQFIKELFSSYVIFLNDIEPELKSIAASKLYVVGPYLSQDEIISSLIPITKTLSSDQQNFVRISLASSFLTLCQYIGKKNTTEHILPTFLALLKDDDSDVRINLFKKLNEITKVLGLDTLS